MSDTTKISFLRDFYGLRRMEKSELSKNGKPPKKYRESKKMYKISLYNRMINKYFLDNIIINLDNIIDLDDVLIKQEEPKIKKKKINARRGRFSNIQIEQSIRKNSQKRGRVQRINEKQQNKTN